MTNVNSLLKKDPKSYSILTSSSEIGENLAVEVYVVGGYVRDVIIGNNLSDIDIMVVGDGINYARKLLTKLDGNSIVPFKKFGTAQILLDDDLIEVSSARSESYITNSRKPKIDSADLRTDLSRRDFTINAMAVSLNKSDFGELHDPYNGIRDLNRGVIQTPLDPNQTFSDDPLRMLRAIRFASQLDFKIDPKIKDSIKKHTQRIDIISAERITAEIFKILDSDFPSKGFDLLNEVGLMEIILPEISALFGLEQPSEWHHKDIFYHTLQVVDNISKYTNKTNLRFAALLHDIGKPKTRRLDKKRGWTFHGHDAVGANMIDRLARRMKLSKETRDYLKKLTLLHLRPIALAKEEVTDSAVRRLLVSAGDEVEDLMTLCRADITSKNPKLVKKYLGNFDRVDKLMRDVSERDAYSAFQSPIRGAQIMEECSLSPGKIVGEIKNAIEDAILDGEINNNYESAYDYFLKIKESFLSKNET